MNKILKELKDWNGWKQVLLDLLWSGIPVISILMVIALIPTFILHLILKWIEL